MVVLNDGETVERDMLPHDFLDNLVNFLNLNDSVGLNGLETGYLGTKKKDVDAIRPLWVTERLVIEEAIELCDGMISRAAGHLDINPSTIYRKIKSWQAREEAEWKPDIMKSNMQ